MSGCLLSGAERLEMETGDARSVPDRDACLKALSAVSGEIRTDWSRQEVQSIYYAPLLELVFRAACVHRLNHSASAVQQCTLLSIKTGGCPEDCAYCPQSARYSTGVRAEPLLDADAVCQAARLARDAGSTRFCMGAAWRQAPSGDEFDQVLEMVRRVASLGIETCVTMGMVRPDQARMLKEAGLTAYNHNLDTSKDFYREIISTRSYADRLETIANVQRAGISVCCGGILGLGEDHEDRVDLLHTLASLPEHPDSVPVNALVAVEGTPLANSLPVRTTEMVRMIATARILMPKAMVRLSAGRVNMALADQALCFMAGANSIFTGDKLLTTDNCDFRRDAEMLAELGLTVPAPAGTAGATSCG